MQNPLAGLSQPIRAAWIEIILKRGKRHDYLSQPIRAAWIEIQNGPIQDGMEPQVAAHSGCVD